MTPASSCHRAPPTKLCGAVLTILLLALGGCFWRADQVYVRAAPVINVNQAGEATPVDLRFYQLRDFEAFRTADFEALWRDDAAVLGDDLLVDAKVVTIRPGEGRERPRRIELGPWADDAQALGVMALFRHPGGQVDRRRIVLSAYEADDYLIELDGYELNFRQH